MGARRAIFLDQNFQSFGLAFLHKNFLAELPENALELIREAQAQILIVVYQEEDPAHPLAGDKRAPTGSKTREAEGEAYDPLPDQAAAELADQAKAVSDSFDLAQEEEKEENEENEEKKEGYGPTPAALLPSLPVANRQTSADRLISIYLPKTEQAWDELHQILIEKNRPPQALKSLLPIVKLLRPYLLFQSEAMLKSLRFLPQIAAAPYPVLLQGETGTGKELVANAIHHLSKQSQAPLVALNCAALPESLIESELFGHEKGAFTGAIRQHVGKFEQANNGSLFLDEIGEMPLNTQVKLLRALETGKITRLGGSQEIAAKPRIIAATQIYLDQAVAKGTFRSDLFYRLNVLTVFLPPLRARKQDIAMLAQNFLEQSFADLGYAPPYPSLAKETLALFWSYGWPGNVRELKNLMARLATLLPAHLTEITPQHLEVISQKNSWEQETGEPSDQGSNLGFTYGSTLQEVKDAWIAFTIEQSGGDLKKAAAVLNMSERHLRRLQQEKGL